MRFREGEVSVLGVLSAKLEKYKKSARDKCVTRNPVVAVASTHPVSGGKEPERSRQTRRVTCLWPARMRDGEAGDRVTGGKKRVSAGVRCCEDVPTGENSPVAAANTVRSNSGVSSVAMLLPGVTDILVSVFPCVLELRVAASARLVRAARPSNAAAWMPVVHPSELARRVPRAQVASATRAVAVARLMVSAKRTRGRLFFGCYPCTCACRAGGSWVVGIEHETLEERTRTGETVNASGDVCAHVSV